MKISVNSLNNYLTKKLMVEEILEALARTEIEVEKVTSANNFDPSIIIGLVKQIKNHPKADRLQVASVTIGRKIIQIVCGAPNIAAGQKVAVAMAGTRLPDGLIIKPTTVRGVKSEAMILSEKELAISDDHSGVMVIEEAVPVGKKLCDVWPNDTNLDVKTPANRWDYQSLLGLAREISVYSPKIGNQLKQPNSSKNLYSKIQLINVKEKGKCQRFATAKLAVKNAVKSPRWLVDNLEGNGLRSINTVVDITNFVMLETGQPAHAYDAAKVTGKLQVRRASPTERLTTIDNVTRQLDKDDLVIADDKKVLGLAGIIGGSSTEVDAQTSQIILEVANFDKTMVRKTAQRHGLRTEASARFERSLPLPLVLQAMDRLLYLFKEICQAKLLAGPADQLYAWPWVQHIGLRLRKAEKLLGLKLDENQVVNGLKSLGFEVEHFSLTKEAKKHLDKPYLWGANFKQNGTTAFDCSYLTEYIYSLIGVWIGHTAQQQHARGTSVSDNDLKPGDLLFCSGQWRRLKPSDRGDIGVTGMYIGQNKVLQAAEARYNFKTSQYEVLDKPRVITVPVSDFINNPGYKGARRYVENFNHILAIICPWWRTDVKLAEDVIEEVIKLIGYADLPATLPQEPPQNNLTFSFLPQVAELKKALVSAGLFEVMTYSMISGQATQAAGLATDQQLELANPLTREQQYLRSSLLPSLLEVLTNNKNYPQPVMFFETAKIYRQTAGKKGELVDERWRLGIMSVGKNSLLNLKGKLDFISQYSRLNFLSQPGAEFRAMIPNRSATIIVDKIKIGQFGQLNPQTLANFSISKTEASFAELELEPLLSLTKEIKARDLPDHQLVDRDVSIEVQHSVLWQEIYDLAIATKQVRSIKFLSEYSGPAVASQTRSLSFRVVFDLGPHPTSREIRKVLASLTNKLTQKLAAKIR